MARRVNTLRRAQNADGGWGYFPARYAKKQSWLEPTLYAALVLYGDAASDRAWALVSSWQREDGSWPSAAGVRIPHAATALCVTMAAVRGEFGEPFRKGAAWLLDTVGIESALYRRVVLRLGRLIGAVEDERNLSLHGWPWKPDTASWVEPTSHALVALKKAAQRIPETRRRERVRSGEALLLDVRCQDGGWNYGNRTARGEELRSYPETTALALVGLQGRLDLGASLDLAAGMLRETTSPLARAWLAIALRLNRVEVNAPLAHSESDDLLVTALEALGAPEGNHPLLRTAA